MKFRLKVSTFLQLLVANQLCHLIDLRLVFPTFKNVAKALPLSVLGFCCD